MNRADKIFLTVAVLLADMLVFMLPLTAFFVIYVIWFRPPWFRERVENLYSTID